MKKMIKRNKICFLIFLFSILLAAAVFPFLKAAFRSTGIWPVKSMDTAADYGFSQNL